MYQSQEYHFGDVISSGSNSQGLNMSVSEDVTVLNSLELGKCTSCEHDISRDSGISASSLKLFIFVYSQLQLTGCSVLQMVLDEITLSR